MILLGSSFKLELSRGFESARTFAKADESTWLAATNAREGDFIVVRQVYTLLTSSKLYLFLSISAHLQQAALLIIRTPGNCTAAQKITDVERATSDGVVGQHLREGEEQVLGRDLAYSGS